MLLCIVALFLTIAPAHAQTTPTPTPVPQSAPCEIPDPIAAVLDAEADAAPADLAAALDALTGSERDLFHVHATAIAGDDAESLPVVLASWGESFTARTAMLLAWRAPEQESWSAQSICLRNEEFVDARTQLTTTDAATDADDSPVYELALIMNPCAVSTMAHCHTLRLYRLEDNAWTQVWDAAGTPDWPGSHAMVQFADSGMNTILIHSTSWSPNRQEESADVAKSHIFREANSGPHRQFTHVWQRREDGYAPSARFTEPSAYNTLVEFLYALKTDGDATPWILSPALEEEARSLQLHELPDGLQTELANGPESAIDGPIAIILDDRALVFHFFHRYGQYLIERIDLLMDSTDIGTNLAPPTPVPTPTPMPREASPAQQIHIVQTGETLSTLAARYQIPPDVIRDANELTPGSEITVGQRIIIPLHARQPVPTATPFLPTAVAPSSLAPSTPPAPVPFEWDARTWNDISPDGTWVATGLSLLPIGGREHYYMALHVRQVEEAGDGTTTWTPLADWVRYGLGYTTPQPLQWSADGRYFYFTQRPTVDGCAPFANGSDVQRLDLRDGSVEELAPPISMVIALAPDGETLAYRADGDTLTLRELSSGEERTVDLGIDAPSAHFGEMVWSPDGTLLALTVAYDACAAPEQRTHAILLVDTQAMTVTPLVDADARRLRTVAWTDNQDIVLRDEEDTTWLLDPATGAIERD